MSEMQIILVRHGATASNLAKPAVLQGCHVDDGLAPLGVQQAAAVARALANRTIAAVYSSPLRRSMETAGAIAQCHNLIVKPVRELREVDVGQWEQFSWPEIERRWPAEHRDFMNDPARCGYLGGENFNDVCERCAPMLDLLTFGAADETVVVIGHNTVNRVLLAHWLEIPLQWARRLPQANAAYNVVVLRNGTTRVRSINVTEHLTGILTE